MPRILSLIASSTEIVCALGLEDSLIGRSHECDYPSTIQSLPSCTAPKFDVNGSSFEIDKRVKDVLMQALSVYSVDKEKIKQLNPDIIITQTQCEVCAVSLKDVENAILDWSGTTTKIVSLEPNELTDIWKDILKVAEASGVMPRGIDLVRNLKKRISDIVEITNLISKKPTVACIEWIDPLMAAGNWIPEMIHMGGGINLFGIAGQHSPWMTFDQLSESDPDIIIVMPCGFDIQRTKLEMAPLTKNTKWTKLKAVHNQKVFLTDGNQYFNRPGPRVVESLEIIAEILHPTHFNFDHIETGWESFN